MIEQNVAQQLNMLALHPTAARTATGQGSAVDVRDYVGEIAIVLDSAAGSGTAPTLDVTIEESDTSGGTYTAVSGAAFTQVAAAAAAEKIAVKVDGLKRFIRAKYTIAGTSPSFTFSVNALGMKQVR